MSQIFFEVKIAGCWSALCRWLIRRKGWGTRDELASVGTWAEILETCRFFRRLAEGLAYNRKL
jgi:hypothetical protein